MNGFAGLKKPRNLRQEKLEFKELAQNLWKECAGLVVGLVAFIERKNEIIFPT